MSESSSNSSSFIPKRKSVGTDRQVRRRHLFLFSLISYALFISAPIASASVYIYQVYTQKIFDQKVKELDSGMSNFSEADMSQVLDFSNRLEAAEKLLQSNLSFVSILSILEQTTSQSVQFNNLKLTSKNPSVLLVDGTLAAGSFDAVLFQRQKYQQTAGIAASTFTNLVFTHPGGSAGSGMSRQRTTTTGATTTTPYTFKASFEFTGDQILYMPVMSQVASSTPTAEPLTTIVSATTTSTTTIGTTTDVLNQTTP